LVDYPGEWLLDLPMLDQSFAAWSAETLARLRAGGRAEAAREFLAFVGALAPDAPAEETLARRGHQLYRAALLECRDRLGFRFLQPGRLLHQGPGGDAPILWFFPLPEGARGGLAELLARRHAAYLAERRASFFDPFFRRFDRQIVLVDVLGALHAGREAYEDTREALAAVAHALRYGGGWLDWLTGAGVAKVAFAATKADHVPERQREALESLLAALVDAPKLRAASGGSATAVESIAAIRCTEDDVAQLEGRTVAVVRGVQLQDGRVAKVFPGEVLAGPPKPNYWEHPFFAMPEFQPPRLTAGGFSGMPHLGMDELLAWLIGDLL
jgi:predicted YcjX-like family ATPase